MRDWTNAGDWGEIPQNTMKLCILLFIPVVLANPVTYQSSVSHGQEQDKVDFLVSTAMGKNVFVVAQVSQMSVFRWKSTAWQLDQELHYMDNVTVNNSGLHVALSRDGKVLAVGHAFHDHDEVTGVDHGAVYIFKENGGSKFELVQTLISPDPGESDKFGQAVDMSGDGSVLIVGSPESEHNTTGTDHGKTFVFRVDDSTGEYFNPEEIPHLVGDQAEFGSNVAISSNGEKAAVTPGNTVMMANPAHGGMSNGIPILFFLCMWFVLSTTGFVAETFQVNKTTLSWGLEMRIIGTLANGLTHILGDDIAMDLAGNQIIYGATTSQHLGFVLACSQATQLCESIISPSATRDIDYFGNQVELSEDGTILCVSSPTDDHDDLTLANSGSVYIYNLEASDTGVKYKLQQTLTAPTPTAQELFGAGLALYNDTLVVSGSQGISYIYNISTSGFESASTTPVETVSGGDFPVLFVALSSAFGVLLLAVTGLVYSKKKGNNAGDDADDKSDSTISSI